MASNDNRSNEENFLWITWGGEYLIRRLNQTTNVFWFDI